jgi:hypothetical protein
MGATVHTFLISLTVRLIDLLPPSVRGELDAWSHRVARKRAQQRHQRRQQG